MCSLSVDDDEVSVRLAIRNDSKEHRRLPNELLGDTLQLYENSREEGVSMASIDNRGNGDRSVDAQSVWVSEFLGKVAAPDRLGPGSMALRIPGFDKVAFDLAEKRPIHAIDKGTMNESWTLDFAQWGEVEALANVPLILRAARVKGGRLEFGLAFRNASRFDLQWRGQLTGGEARLWTIEGESLRPLAVSEGLRNGVGPDPSDPIWKSGAERAGTISFPLPHPLAGNELSFAFPGYPAVHLQFDPAVKRWEVAQKATAARPTGAAESARAEEALFRDLQAFWEGLAERLEQRDFQGYLEAFGGSRSMRVEQTAFAAGLAKVPVTWIEFVLPPRQKLASAVGRVRGLEVELRCGLAGVPRGNEFVAVMECDLERQIQASTWKVTSLEHRLRPPFWTLGFREVKSSEHFLVLHKSDDDDATRARSALAQLETAYDELGRQGIPLGSRYVAFVIPDAADFVRLTGRDPRAYSGASSATYAERNGELSVINQALFINDFRFSSLQRVWGRQDRQITIQHELVHLALAAETRPWTPAWLVEGTAVVFGGQMKDIADRAPPDPQLEDLDIAALSQLPALGAGVRENSRVLSQYLASARAVEALLKSEGQSALLRLYRSFADLEPEEWRMNGDGVRRQTVTEPPELQAARLRLTERQLSVHAPAVSLNALTVEAAGSD